ncbi:membrane protein [Agromyces luteolus]|uniref:Tripartite tricarboxylate transporter TctB family protein n=1 Tax=Agromyces luteolus TaxID=88373 RepID=A0A7C9LVA6_9MICO|nr:tripartite tricarboxylate transporter TctB family protein [Agromyces luteolus]MUN06639.1 tripartite tricarboxylate transporter TctB family protein [Agromyces luteolus]GLK29335.1 membrane protein [Agromyces luteolus]
MTESSPVPLGATAPGGTPDPATGAPADGAADGRAGPGLAGEYAFAAVSAALGAYAIIGAGFIRVPPGSASVLGPRAFPYAVGVLLLVASVAVVVQIARGRRGVPDDGEDVDPDAPTDWLTVAKLVAIFLSQLVLIESAGWPVAVAVVFGGAAIVLGAKRWWMALLIGLGLGLVTQLVFGAWLGLSLPAGPLLDWIPIFHG